MESTSMAKPENLAKNDFCIRNYDGILVSDPFLTLKKNQIRMVSVEKDKAILKGRGIGSGSLTIIYHGPIGDLVTSDQGVLFFGKMWDTVVEVVTKLITELFGGGGGSESGGSGSGSGGSGGGSGGNTGGSGGCPNVTVNVNGTVGGITINCGGGGGAGGPA